VAVEVLLEVEVREGLAISDREELLERRIGRDRVLVLEVLLLDVHVDRLRDLRARHERALGLREEGAELVRHLDGALEDRGNAGLGLLALNGRRAALALAGILDLAVDTLVELLDLREHGRDRLLERREVARHRLEVLVERRRGRHRRGGNDLNGRRGDNDRRSGRLRRLGRRRLLDRGGRSRRDRGRNLLLLRSNYLLRDGLGGRGTHYTGG